MPDERWALLGLARPTAPWFRDLARGSAAGELPGVFTKCISADDLQARLGSGRRWSAALLDGSFPGVDRDLLHQIAGHGAISIVVDDPAAPRRDWPALGATTLLGPAFARRALLDLLRAEATPVRSADQGLDPGLGSVLPGGWRGRLVAVTGPGGGGRSTAAIALAQGLAGEPGARGSVLLADLCLHADLALLHDAADLVPGVLDLVEAHRAAQLTVEQVRSLVFTVDDRGYHLLLGLRRHRDWTALRPRAVAAALDGLLRSYRVTVADVDADAEGADETGSLDVEERNALARATLARADAVCVVTGGGLHGLHGFGRTLAELRLLDVAPDRVIPVVNGAPKNPRDRAEHARATAELTAAICGGRGSVPVVFLPWQRRVEAAHHVGGPLPSPLPDRLSGAVRAVLDRVDRPQSPAAAPIRPGTLGLAGASW